MLSTLKRVEQSFHTVMHGCAGNEIRTINHLFQYKWNTTSKRQQTVPAEEHQPPCGVTCMYTRVYFMHDLQYCFIYTNSPPQLMVSVCSCRWRKQGSSKCWTSTTASPIGNCTSRCCSELCCSKQNPKAIES